MAGRSYDAERDPNRRVRLQASTMLLSHMSSSRLSIAVRRARMSDLDGLVALEEENFDGDRISRRSLRRWLGQSAPERTGTILIATRSDGVRVGYGLVQLRRDSADARVYSICVSPRERGSGVGRMLLEALEREAKKRGYAGVRLEVSGQNRAAIRLYEESGYAAFGTYPDYYHDGSVAIRYRKSFDRSTARRKGGRLS